VIFQESAVTEVESKKSLFWQGWKVFFR